MDVKIIILLIFSSGIGDYIRADFYFTPAFLVQSFDQLLHKSTYQGVITKIQT